MFFDSLELKNIHYAVGDRTVLGGASLSVEKGDSIAILGPSGEGKSTLLRIATGLIKPTSGKVLVNGEPLEEVLTLWHRSLYMLSQRSHLFRRSIRENLLLAKESATEREIWNALIFVEMEERVKQWGGLDSVVYRDFQPSGGEKSRLLIARGVLRNPEVLILDEPLEGVDKEAELRVVTRIREFARGRTLIVVSHRLSILSLAEKFATLEDGKITSYGRLEEHGGESLLRRYIDAEKKMSGKFLEG